MAPQRLDQRGRIRPQVEHSVRRQRAGQLRLLARDRLDRAEVLEVGAPDVGDERLAGTGQDGERGDLARMVGSDLHHRRPVLRAEAKQRERHAPVVVQVPFGPERGPFDRQHPSHQVLGGGLARASGDADHEPLPGEPVLARQLLEGPGHVLDHHQRAGPPVGEARARAQGGRRPAPECLLQELVAVGATAGERHE